MTDPHLDPQNLSQDVSKSPRRCPRDNTPMVWLGEMIHCPDCNLMILVNQAAIQFNMITVGQLFVTPPRPDVIWRKTSYEVKGEANAVQINDESMVTSFSAQDIMILAHNRLQAGLFSYN